MEDRAYIMVYGYLLFCTIVPEILKPKHHAIQEFGQNWLISAIKF
jgi:hypothetical protein